MPECNKPQPRYDLEKRTKMFAISIRKFIIELPKTISNIEDSKQLARASGSIAANYIEANESLSKKDFCMRIKISRKEAKECRLFIEFLRINDKKLEAKRQILLKEATEILLILSSIHQKACV